MSFFVSTAYAAATAPVSPSGAGSAAAAASSPGQVMMLNMLMVLVLVSLFYVLMIMPQQKRFKKHRSMLDSLKKGDKVITAAGFVATVDKTPDEKSTEVVLDLGNGMKVTALRHTIQTKMDETASK